MRDYTKMTNAELLNVLSRYSEKHEEYKTEFVNQLDRLTLIEKKILDNANEHNQVLKELEKRNVINP